MTPITHLHLTPRTAALPRLWLRGLGLILFAFVASPPTDGAAAAVPVETTYDALTVRLLPPTHTPVVGTVLVMVKPGTAHVDPTVVSDLGMRGFYVIQFLDQQPGGTQSWKRVLASMASDAGIDPTRVFMLGFSASGPGVMQSVLSEPGVFRGGISICHCAVSPPTTPEARQVPLLILTGDGDANQPAIRQLVANRYAGFDCTLVDIPGHAHQWRLEDNQGLATWMIAHLPALPRSPRATHHHD